MREAKLALAALATSGLVLVATGSTLAGPLTYTLPSETATLKKASGARLRKGRKNMLSVPFGGLHQYATAWKGEGLLDHRGQ